jgi:adenylate cyclase
VAATLRDLPILLLLAHRPLEPTSEPLPSDLQIELRDLSPLEAEQAIRAKVAQLFSAGGEEALAPLIERLIERAQGNPFYLEELINYLHDLGLDPSSAQDFDTLELPSSLHSLVLSRIDHLSSRQQLLLKVASVLGRRFGFLALQSVYPGNDEAEIIRLDLDAMAKVDLTPLDTPEPELSYLFKHIITQEAAYESLAYATRAALHEQVGLYLEQTIGETGGVDLLAYHYGLSNHLPKKRHYLRRAGEAAAARYANGAALSYLSRALELTPETDLAEQLLLLRWREQVYALQGMREAQHQDLRDLTTLAASLADPAQQAEIEVRQANYAYLIGDYAEAIAAATRAAELAEIAGASFTAARAQQEWTWALIGQGNYSAAQSHAEECLRQSEAASDPRGVSRAYQALGEIAGYQGDHTTERSHYEQALAIVRAIGDRRREGGILNNLGVVAANQGDVAAARLYYEQNLRIDQEIGNRRGEAFVLGNLGVLATEQGDTASAHVYLEQCLRIVRTIGDRQGETIALGSLSKIAHVQGDNQSARVYGQQALDLSQAVGDQYGEGFAQLMLGDALIGLELFADAGAAFDAALQLRRPMGQPLMSDALAGQARVHLAGENPAAALESIAEIQAYLDSDGMLDGTEDALLILLTCFQALAAAGDPRAPQMLHLTHEKLQERAATLPDEPSLQMFLAIPHHRTILAAWDARPRTK